MDKTKETFLKQTPEEVPDMVTISKEAFYATVGQLNVNPYPVGNWDNIFGYKTEWRTPERILRGISFTESYCSNGRYMVSEAFFESHREEINKNC